MAAEESRGQVWIIADELPVLKRQAELETLVVRGRKRGLCAVLGFQAITQLRAIYGADSIRSRSIARRASQPRSICPNWRAKHKASATR
jgi:type IV secretory pathway TraG/TraD family ATPase VirD4